MIHFLDTVSGYIIWYIYTYIRYISISPKVSSETKAKMKES